MPRGVQVRPLLPAPRQKKPTALRFRRGGESSVSVGSFFLSETGVSRGTPVSVMGNGSDLDCPGAPRQKNAVPLRFRGLHKCMATRGKRATNKACRENCASAASFFLSETGVSRGLPFRLWGTFWIRISPFSGAAPSARNDPLRANAKRDSRFQYRNLVKHRRKAVFHEVFLYCSTPSLPVR